MNTIQKLLSAIIFGLFCGCAARKDAAAISSISVNEIKETNKIECRDDEKSDDIRNICWKKCRIVETWDGKECTAYAERLKYEQAVERCEKLGGRLPTIAEFESVLGNCRDWTNAPGWRRCNRCEDSKECENLLGEWFYHQGFGLWASNKNQDPKRVIIWTGWILPRNDGQDPNEEQMWAVCVRQHTDVP